MVTIGGFLEGLGHRLAWRSSTKVLSEGLCLAVAGDTSVPENDVLIKLGEAVAVIKRYDPSLHRQLRRHADGVLARGRVWEGFIGQWSVAIKACVVNEEWVAKPETTVIRIASVLVHELTHARLESYGISYHEKRRVRIEKCCRDHELAFLSIVPGADKEAKLVEREASAFETIDPNWWSDAAQRSRGRLGLGQELSTHGFPRWIVRVVAGRHTGGAA